MTTAFEALKMKSASPTPASSGGTSAFDALKAKPATADVSQETTPKEGGFKSFAKSLVSAPLTMIARPFQALAELGGASDESVDKFSKEKLGGFVAPTPKNFSDVKKDVGRGIQTVAFGAGGPVTAGAGLGFGASLEQGNDVFSVPTLMNTVLGAASGKVLDLVGKPILDAAGKVVGKITPKYIQDVASKGTKAIQDFASEHNILPENMSKALTKGANTAEEVANKPFDYVGSKIKGAFTATPEKIIAKRSNILQKLEDNNTSLKKYVTKQNTRGFDPKKDAAVGNLLGESVDDTGTIRTTQSGGAIEQYNDFIKPKEAVVSNALKAEGRSIPLADVEKKLIKSIDSSGVKGASRTEAFAKLNREIEGYKMELDPTGKIPTEKLDVPVEFLHNAKVDKYANVNYMNENGRVDKAIAKTLKTLVEDNTSSVEVAKLNRELSKHYANIGYLEKLNGKKVEGGRLGKYFAKTVGAIAGSHFGPLGTIAGAELAGSLKGKALSRTFGSKLEGVELTDSPLMKRTIKAQESGKGYEPYTPEDKLPTIDYSNSRGSRNTTQSKTTTPVKNSNISKSINKGSSNVKRSVFGRKK